MFNRETNNFFSFLKIITFIIAGLTIIIGTFYSFPSYRLSILAKYDYFEGKYEQAFEEAQEAYQINPYNNMAFVTMNKAKSNLDVQEFIEEAKNYRRDMEALVEEDAVGNRSKVKMICEIVIDRYALVISNHGIVTGADGTFLPQSYLDKELASEANKQYLFFEKVYTSVFKR